MEWLTTLLEKHYTKLRGTCNQVWNALYYVLSCYIAGVKAKYTAWSKYEVKPNMTHITLVKQIDPNVKCPVTVDVKKTEDRYNVNFILPEKRTLSVHVSKMGEIINKILENVQVVYKNHELKKHTKGSGFESKYSEYLKFSIYSETS